MELNTFQTECLRTWRGDLLGTLGRLNAVMGLCGEAGETCEHLKKEYFHGKPLDKNAVALELGDCLYYLAMLAHELDIPLNDVAILNIDKLRERYPLKFTTYTHPDAGSMAASGAIRGIMTAAPESGRVGSTG
jgi:NTP pyrophosphatase (non-canonical NTP hydrolase)